MVEERTPLLALNTHRHQLSFVCFIPSPDLFAFAFFMIISGELPSREARDLPVLAATSSSNSSGSPDSLASFLVCKAKVKELPQNLIHCFIFPKNTIVIKEDLIVDNLSWIVIWDLGAPTCSNAFRPIHQHHGNDRNVPLRLNALVVIIVALQESLIMDVEDGSTFQICDIQVKILPATWSKLPFFGAVCTAVRPSTKKKPLALTQ
ncbi:hypothetical protein E2C01_023118 [Portunus trituberculatus]|uniref:Uncharacterized protein n=1 Tax=Portunus trituberculatus TaxID=210409 RepID=A0A5B7E9J2_PORTR|nr:hypothetical protein [Portunus trituberculatus]